MGIMALEMAFATTTLVGVYPSLPKGGTYLLATFATGLIVLVLWHLIAGRMQATRAEKERLAVGAG